MATVLVAIRDAKWNRLAIDPRQHAEIGLAINDPCDIFQPNHPVPAPRDHHIFERGQRVEFKSRSTKYSREPATTTPPGCCLSVRGQRRFNIAGDQLIAGELDRVEFDTNHPLSTPTDLHFADAINGF